MTCRFVRHIEKTIPLFLLNHLIFCRTFSSFKKGRQIRYIKIWNTSRRTKQFLCRLEISSMLSPRWFPHVVLARLVVGLYFSSSCYNEHASPSCTIYEGPTRLVCDFLLSSIRLVLVQKWLLNRKQLKLMRMKEILLRDYQSPKGSSCFLEISKRFLDDLLDNLESLVKM